MSARDERHSQVKATTKFSSRRGCSRYHVSQAHPMWSLAHRLKISRFLLTLGASFLEEVMLWAFSPRVRGSWSRVL